MKKIYTHWVILLGIFTIQGMECEILAQQSAESSGSAKVPEMPAAIRQMKGSAEYEVAVQQWEQLKRQFTESQQTQVAPIANEIQNTPLTIQATTEGPSVPVQQPVPKGTNGLEKSTKSDVMQINQQTIEQ